MSSKLILCPNCLGKGKIVTSQGHINFSNKCEICKGTGKVKK